MPFGKELSHLIEEQINRSVEHNATSTSSAGNASRSGGDEGRIAQLEANLQKLGEKFSGYLSSQKNRKRNVVDYGLSVIALHELRLAVTAGRAIFIDQDEPVDMPYTYLQLTSAGTERQIRYIYLDTTGVVLESTTDPTNIGTGYIPLAMVDMWTGITEITQDKIKDIRPMIGAEESNSKAQDNHELNGNVTLYSPDTGNDSFIVSATNPAGLTVNVTSGRALVDGEMLNAEGGRLDLTSHRNIVKEFIAFSDGTTKTFPLYHKAVSNVVIYSNDVETPVTVDAANGSITFAAAPMQDAKITASYTFSGNYMLIVLVERAQTNDGKAFGVINWKAGTNRAPSEPPDLTTYQHAIAKVDMSSSITAITNGIIDNSYEVKNLTQYDLQYGGKLDGSSLKAGAINFSNLNPSIQSSIATIDQIKTEMNTTTTAIENAKKSITDTQSDIKAKYTELTQATSELRKTDQSLTSTIAGNKTDMEGKLNSAVSQIKQTTDNLSTTVVSNKKDADDKNKAAVQQMSQIQQAVDSISSTVSTNKSDADSKISTIKQTVDGISSTVSANKADADGKISTLKQTADSITAIVASNKTDIEGKLFSAVSQIKQTTDGISATVATNKTDMEGKLNSTFSQLKQTSDSISSNVSNLANIVETNRENLLHPEEWYVTDDANNKFSYFSALTASKNEIIKESNPFGVPVNCWKVTDAGHHNTGGGYNTQQFTAKDTKTYRFTAYFKKKIDQEGTCYFGCDTSNTANLSGVRNDNPYFWCGDLPNLDQWYLLVGYVHGKEYTGISYGGMYDMNGSKIVDFTDYKMLSGATYQRARHYLYYVTAGNPELYIYAPRVEEVDGTELSLDQFFPNMAKRITGNTSQITQTANSISAVITELGKPIDQCSYTAISQAKDAINLRVKSSDYNGKNIVSQINVSPAGTLIDGKMLHVTGQTVFDDNVIVGRMLQAGSVNAAKIAAGAVTADKIAAGVITAGQIATSAITADKIAVGAVTSEKITTGCVISDKIAAGAVNAEKISATLAEIKGKLTADQIDAGIISADKITTGTLRAELIYAAGYRVKAVAMVKGIVAHKSTIPLPDGYIEEQCVWGLLGDTGEWWGKTNGPRGAISNVRFVTTVSRVVLVTCDRTYSTQHGGGEPSSYTTYPATGAAYYWIMGVK
jgi:predicted  nucleic acid-binding Zn-ribbon protein